MLMYTKYYTLILAKRPRSDRLYAKDSRLKKETI